MSGDRIPDSGRNGRAWALHVSSFSGNVGHGHVYASLSRLCDSHYVTVESVLTEEWAQALNRLEDDFEYKSGIECERFLDEETCRRRAVEMFLDVAEDGDVLYDSGMDVIARK